MADVEAFERRLARAYRYLVEDVPGEVDAAAVARRVAGERPRHGGRVIGWGVSAVPRVAWLLLLIGLVVGLVVGLVAGSRPDRLLSVVPHASAEATVAPTDESPSLTPDEVSQARDAAISALLGAWHRGDTTTAERLYATDHALTVIGDPVGGSEHFQVLEGGRGYVYWEPAGATVHGRTYWALPSVSGVWDPGNDVIAVFRFDPQNRIADEWVIAAKAWSKAAHEARKKARAPSAGLLAFLERCTRRDASADTWSACYAPDAGFWIAANGSSGWTETYLGDHAWITGWGRNGSSAYDRITRTGDGVQQGVLVAYPFESSEATCAEGIDVVELAKDETRIAGHWTFCGPIQGE